ncbi:MAG: alpha/beta fold hydrolase [Desulfuromonadales bacterium]|nr:alpha/beta fold hydrolase [Desulfuromonadales bacterium]
MWSIWLTLFLVIFTLFLALNLLVVILSYSMCWYEYANSAPQLMERRFSSRSLRMVLSLIAQETFFNVLTLLVIPFGLINPRRHPRQRGETPILLLHGLFNNRASWFWFKRFLRKEGFNNIATINLSSWHNEEVLTELVAKKVDELRHRLGVDKVHLVSHSMGGIIARNFIQLRGGAGKVDRCICLGSPHFGSKLTPFTLAPLGNVLIPGSQFLQRLTAAPAPTGVRMTNIYTTKDNMILPNTNTRLPWGEAVELDGMGHTGLIYRQAALRAVSTALKKVAE